MAVVMLGVAVGLGLSSVLAGVVTALLASSVLGLVLMAIVRSRMRRRGVTPAGAMETWREAVAPFPKWKRFVMNPLTPLLLFAGAVLAALLHSNAATIALVALLGLRSVYGRFVIRRRWSKGTEDHGTGSDS
jgi:hypothetical protein